MASTDPGNQRPSVSEYQKSTAILMARRAARIAVLLLAVVAVLALVVASPLALKSLGSLHGLNWFHLSYIGQTYGGASALLTGLALIGVAGSIVLQARAINASREQSSREHHAHLVEMTFEDPVYQRAWGSDPTLFAPDAYRQQVYLNLIVSHWQRDYRFNGIAEHALRGSLARLFRGEAARLWWARTGGIRMAGAANRRDKLFCRIVDEEYRKAVSSGPPIVPAQARDTSALANHRVATDRLLKAGVAVLIGAVGGAILGRSYRKA
jgi:hypothetical protein